MRIFRIYAHLAVSIQRFFYAIIQNVHKNRWMETQLVSAEMITDTDLFSFYHVELFTVILQSRFLDIYSGPEFHFWKWGEFPSWVTHVRGDFFILRVGGGHFSDIFQKYIFISPNCLIMQCLFDFTLVQLLHNSLHTEQAWFRELYVRQPFTPGSHILRLQCVCSPCAVCKRCGM